ncbi:hypothetical protein [Ferrovibrio sp.]|uniref:hypothetical protein n=1 Tax=Ferrovibrio sp. TaxID=1917215 RepID=UPI0025C28BF4|nr:hypothetical protein [Ferrovibrio sp.]MBX3453451.1 hypothetical protein [Ferrovibrio sp.]
MLKFAGVALLGLSLLGCNTTRFERQKNQLPTGSELGQTTLTVMGLTRWDDIADKLQPEFTLTPADALGRVLPITGQNEEFLRSVLGFSGAFSPAFSSLNSSRTVSTTDGVSTSTASKTLTRSDGEVPETNDVDLSGKAKDIGRASGMLGQVNPVLHYESAFNFFTYVQILNNTIKSVAKQEDEEAFILRVKVGAQPYYRSAGVDLYASLSVFLANRATELPSLPDWRLKEIVEQYKAANEKIKPAILSKAVPTQPKPDDALRTERVRVLPLLASDNIELTQSSRSANELRQFSLALNLMVKGFGASLGADKLNEALQTYLTREENSVMAVTSLTENSVQARFGATRIGADAYAMSERVQNITLLVFVPKKEKRTAENLRVTGRILARNAATGEPKDYGSADPIEDYISPALDKAAFTYSPKKINASALDDIKLVCNTSDLAKKLKDISTAGNDATKPADAKEKFDRAFKWELFNLSYRNLPGCFKWMLEAVTQESDYWQFLWNDLAQAAGASNRMSGYAQLQDAPAEEAPNSNQLVLLQDDGKAETRATIFGGKNLPVAKLTGRLPVGTQEYLYGRVAAGSAANTIQIAFPSLKALELKPETNAKLELLKADGSVFSSHPVKLSTIAEKPTAAIELKTSISQIAASNGEGSLRLLATIKTAKVGNAEQAMADNVEIAVAGAELVNAEGSAVSLKGDKAIITGNGAVTLKLRNLIRGEKVRLAAIAKKGGKTVQSENLEWSVAVASE